jgi:hypothetical protein
VAVTATFRVFYVFVVMEVGTRRILHWNVTEPYGRVDRGAIRTDILHFPARVLVIEAAGAVMGQRP